MSFALRCSLICMGKLIYGFNVSVDGYIADAQGNIDWSDPSEELHQYWNDFERETALSFYGRRLYELMSAYWPTADKTPDATPLIVDFAHIWRDMPKVVFSRTLESVDWNSRLERGDPVEVVTKLKAETDGVWLSAAVYIPPNTATPYTVVARYDGGKVVSSWCSLPVSNSCAEPYDDQHPATVPDAIFANWRIGSPGFGAMTNSTRSAPLAPGSIK